MKALDLARPSSVLHRPCAQREYDFQRRYKSLSRRGSLALDIHYTRSGIRTACFSILRRKSTRELLDAGTPGCHISEERITINQASDPYTFDTTTNDVFID